MTELLSFEIQQPLRQPVVSCPLGKLYNKEAVISYLLNPPSATEHSPFGSDGLLVASHIRSLKDVTTLRLTPNPSLDESNEAETEATTHGGGTSEQMRASPFVCPISLREMNGSIKFVYRKPCGCVMSEVALKEMRRGQEKKGEAAQKEDQGELSDERVCPVDGERSEKPEEWVTLNPKEEELETMQALWEAKKVREKEDKKAAKAAKRKGGEGGDDSGVKAKKQKVEKSTSVANAKAAAPAVKAGASVPHLQATLAAKLAEQKKQQSPAIASLYRDKGLDETKVSRNARSIHLRRVKLILLWYATCRTRMVALPG